MFRWPWTVCYIAFIVLNITRKCWSSSTDDTAGIIEGDIVLGGLFRVRNINGTNRCSKDVEVEVGIQRVEAMLYAIREVNKDPNLLPKIMLGAEIRDTCSLKTKALDESLKFVLDSLALHSSSPQSEQCVRNISKDVVGVVGASRSTLSIEVAKLLRLFHVPQVSYASTSAELSDNTKYNYFARTVPPDSQQALAMLHVVQKFQWMSVFTINSAGSYGEKGIEQFKMQAEGVCVVLSVQVTNEFQRKDYDEIITRLFEFPSTKVVVLFLEDNHLKMLLQAAKRKQYLNKVWIASDEWGTRQDIVENLGDFFDYSDAITVTLQSLGLPKFESYFRNLTGVEPRKENPWFQQYWQQCGNFTCNAPFNDKLPYVIDAVYAFAHALHDMYAEKCPDMSGLCSEMRPVDGSDLRDRILKVRFEGKSSSAVSFDKRGDSKGKYILFHFTRRNRYMKLGEWQNELNLLNVSARLTNITSTCHDQCNLWSRKLVKKGTTCCTRCLDCPNKERQYVNAKEATCIDCSSTQRPNGNYSGCEDLPLRYISQTWFIMITLFASLGALCTLLVTTILLCYINTPLVKASERDLIFLLLLGVLLNYVMALVFVSRPNVVLCTAQRIGYGLAASICYSSLVVKIDRIGRIFARGKMNAVQLIKPQTQLVVVFLLIAVEASLTSAGLVIKQPEIIKVLPTNENIFAKCNFGSLDKMISLPFNFILVLLCTFGSFRIRKATSTFNEAKYLGLVMYSTCIIWTAFIPVHIGTAESYQPITMSLNTTLNATTILICLFGPKVYIIVFRPSRNVERTASVTAHNFVMNQQNQSPPQAPTSSRETAAGSQKQTSNDKKANSQNMKIAEKHVNCTAKEMTPEQSSKNEISPSRNHEKVQI